MLGNAPNPALPQDVHVSTTGFKEIGTISLKHIYEISKIKKGDDHMKHIGLEELAKSIMGTCKNIGIRVVRKSKLAWARIRICNLVSFFRLIRACCTILPSDG